MNATTIPAPDARSLKSSDTDGALPIPKSAASDEEKKDAMRVEEEDEEIRKAHERELMLRKAEIQREMQRQTEAQQLKDTETISRFRSENSSMLEKWELARQLGDVSRLTHQAALWRAEKIMKQACDAKFDFLTRLLGLKAMLGILEHGTRREGLDITQIESQSIIVAGLIQLAGDEFIPARRHAVRGLRSLGQSAIGAADICGTTALEEKDARLRLDAVKTLGAFGIGALKVLIRVMKAEYWPVKREACRAMGSLADWQEVAPSMMVLDACTKVAELLSDRDQDVRESAAHALGCMGVKAMSAVPRLVVCLKDKHMRVRTSAAWSLAEIIVAVETTEEGFRVLTENAKDEEEQEELLSKYLKDDDETEFRKYLRAHAPLKEMLKKSGITTDLTQLVCRCLTSVMRDPSPQHSYLHSAGQAELHTGVKMTPQQRAGPASLRNTPRDNVSKLVREADLAFERMGRIALQPLCRRILLTEDGGYWSRMAVMRALHSTKLISGPTLCAFLSEWCLMEGSRERQHDPSDWINSLPLSDTRVVDHQLKDDVAWALVTPSQGDFFLVFAVTLAHNFRWMSKELVVPREVDHYDTDGSKTEQKISVHSGFWDAVDKVWNDICAALYRGADEGGIKTLSITGGGLGGSLAQVMAIRLFASKDPLGVPLPMVKLEKPADPSTSGNLKQPVPSHLGAEHRSLSTRDFGEPGNADMSFSTAPEAEDQSAHNFTGGIATVAFGCPRVLTQKGRDTLHTKVTLYGNPQSTLFYFEQDPLPAMLSQQHAHVMGHISEHHRKASVSQFAICSRRKRHQTRFKHLQQDYEAGGWQHASEYGIFYNERCLKPPPVSEVQGILNQAAEYGSFKESVSRLEIYSNAMCDRLQSFYFKRPTTDEERQAATKMFKRSPSLEAKQEKERAALPASVVPSPLE